MGDFLPHPWNHSLFRICKFHHYFIILQLTYLENRSYVDFLNNIIIMIGANNSLKSHKLFLLVAEIICNFHKTNKPKLSKVPPLRAKTAQKRYFHYFQCAPKLGIFPQKAQFRITPKLKAQLKCTLSVFEDYLDT